jgi:hypothetical protein
MSQGSVETS